MTAIRAFLVIVAAILALGLMGADDYRDRVASAEARRDAIAAARADAAAHRRQLATLQRQASTMVGGF